MPTSNRRDFIHNKVRSQFRASMHVSDQKDIEDLITHAHDWYVYQELP